VIYAFWQKLQKLKKKKNILAKKRKKNVLEIN